MASGLPSPSFNYPGAVSSFSEFASTSSRSQHSKRHSVPASPSQGPRPLHLLNLAGSNSPTVLSPTRPSLASSPIQSPSSIGFSFSAPHSRSSTPRSVKRQSAISYFSPNHESTREKDVMLKRTSSPLHTTSFGGGGTTGARPGDGDIRPSIEALVPSKTTNVSVVETQVVEKQKDRPPATSAEKHAELLHFIAQKEAKCLELRAQLAMHEDELAQLKRKWERIINRGLERENSPSPSYPSSSSPANTKDIPAALMSLTSNPSLTLEGIREGVQGMSRMLAAGLSITGPDSLQSNHAKLGVSRQSSSSPIPPSPLSASSTLESESTRAFVRHTPRESHSSSATRTTSSTRFSQGSSSATSLEDEEEPRKNAPYDSPQELMINDTGATPTVSPNPAFLEQNERRRLRQEKEDSRKEEILVEDEVAWDAWGDVDGEGSLVEPVSTVRIMDAPKTRASPTATAVLPLASSIPTFGAASQSIAGLTALASPQMSSWVGNMGKKIGGELQKSSSALSRSQKRASLMISDMSQSFVSALTTPTTDGQPTTSRAPSPLPPTGTSGSKHSLSLSASLAHNLSGSKSNSSSLSLLDDEDEDGLGPLKGSLPNGNGAGGPPSPGMAVMEPDVKAKSSPSGTATTQDDDDDWNW